MKPINKRDIEFLYEIGTLRNLERVWKQVIGMKVASDPEHTFRVIFIALLISRCEGVKDEEKIIKMALVHDISESRVGDAHYVNKCYTNRDEIKAANDIFSGTSFEDLNRKILLEFEARKTIEAKIVKDADNLDVDFELKELAERGSKIPEKWKKIRKNIRDKKFYTKTAKKLWDLIQKSNPSDWHLPISG